MTEDIIVRRAKVGDLHGLADLAARSFRDTFEADNDARNVEHYLRSSLTVESTREELGDSSNIFLIVCRDGQADPVGYAKLSATTDDPSVDGQHTIEIERIYADKSEIGRGIGAALMRTCLATADDLGCDAIWLGVWERNEHAIHFYERWGFVTVGDRQFALGPELQTDLVMAKALTK